MNRCLFIACTQYQLLYALQIKCSVLRDIECDIIVMNTECNLDGVVPLFDKAVWCKYNSAPPSKDAFKCFINPLYALNEYYLEKNNLDFDQYSDVFYFGPCWVYYFLFKYFKKSKHDYQEHIYPEGDGGYRGYIENPPLKWYGNVLLAKAIKLVDYYYYGYGRDNIDKAVDLYIIAPQYLLQKPMIPVVEVPVFDVSDLNFRTIINNVFRYEHVNVCKKIIYIDGSLDGSREDLYDVKQIDNLLIGLGKQFGKDTIVVKKHHRTSMSAYSEEVKKNVSFFEKSFPWEIAFINCDIRDCVIMGWQSSAITNPLKFGICDVPIYILNNIIDLKIDIDESFISKFVSEENNKITIVNNVEELLNDLVVLREKKKL